MAGLLINPTDAEILKYIDRRENFHVEGGKQKKIQVELKNCLKVGDIV